MKKMIYIFGGIIAVLLVGVILFLGREDKGTVDTTMSRFIKIVEAEKYEDLTLTIYYEDPRALTVIPLTVSSLVENDSGPKIVIEGAQLKENADLLKQIAETSLVPTEKGEYANIVLYYVFESKKYGKILDVAMWNGKDNIIVNGFTVEGEQAFKNLVKPFLPQEAAEVFKPYLK